MVLCYSLCDVVLYGVTSQYVVRYEMLCRITASILLLVLLLLSLLLLLVVVVVVVVSLLVLLLSLLLYQPVPACAEECLCIAMHSCE